MKDRYFIDTDILVYANDLSQPEKKQKAQQIILSGIREDTIALSTQVLSEFFITVTRKIKVPLSSEIAKKEIQLLGNSEIVDIDMPLVIQAIDISKKHQLSYWDSLIISAAVRSRSVILYSEDLTHNQTIEGIKIVNPFI